MAGFKKKTLKEIQSDIIGEYTTRIRKCKNTDSPLLPIAVVRSLAWAESGVAVMMWNHLGWVYLQILPQYCGPVILKLWGSLMGLEYKTGTNTVLQIKLTNVVTTVMAGTTWKNLKTGVVYKSLSNVEPVGGAALVVVRALTPGPAGNLEAEEVLNITNPFDGIPDKAIVESVLVSGSNDEDIENYRKRVLIKFRQKPQGGSAVDYFLWATEVPGIVDAFPYVLESGTNVIYLVGEGSGTSRTPAGNVAPNPFPEWENGNMKEISGSGLFFQAAKSINGTEDLKNSRRPAGAVVELKKPVYTPYRIEIAELVPNTNEMLEKVKSAIISYLDSRKPHIPALGYPKQDAVINSNQINALVQNAVNFQSGTFGSFVLKNGSGKVINEDTLGIGALAFLEKLTVNGVDVAL